MEHKDPAFLFYAQDFLMGTIFFTNEERGIYIYLLCIQHQHGGIIKKSDFNKIAGKHKKIREKFVEIEEGFYNARLLEEMGIRQKKSSNLSANAKKRWDQDRQKKEEEEKQKQMQLHMQKDMPGICPEDTKEAAALVPTEDEDENENENKKVIESISKKSKVPSREQVIEYCREQNWPEYTGIKFFDFYDDTGWFTKGDVPRPIRSWQRVLERWVLEDLQEEGNKGIRQQHKAAEPDKVIKGSSMRRG